MSTFDQFDEEAHRWMESSGSREFVGALEERELHRAAKRLDITQIHRLPETFTDGDLSRFAVRGATLRFIPFEENGVKVPGQFEDLFEQVVNRPGWYALYRRPLKKDDISEKFLVQPPETVGDFFKALDLVQIDLPGHPDEPPILANFPELLWLIDRNAESFHRQELMLSSAVGPEDAVSIEFEEVSVKAKSYRLDEPFEGAIFPIRRID